MKADFMRILPAAYDVLGRWTQKHVPLDDLMDDLRAHENPAHCRSVQALLLTYFRHACAVDDFVQTFSFKMKARIKRYAVLALVQALYLQGVSPEACIDCAVENARKIFGKTIGNFLNMVFRRALSERAALPADHWPEFVETRRAHLAQNVRDELARIERIKPEMTFHLFAGAEPDFSCIPLACDFLSGMRFFQCMDAKALFSSDCFKENRLYIQDPSGFWPGALTLSCGIKKEAVRTVLDLCAAVGGKSLIWAQLFEPELLCAFDRSERRQQRTAENLQARRGLFPRTRFEIVCGDGTTHTFKRAYDLVAVDAPCSNSAVYRHRPDAAYAHNQESLNELTTLQRALLHHAASCVNEKGYLVYSTCSLDCAENEENVAQFLSEHPDFALIKQETLYPSSVHDGAFAALLQRS